MQLNLINNITRSSYIYYRLNETDYKLKINLQNKHTQVIEDKLFSTKVKA